MNTKNQYKTVCEWFESIPYPNLKKAALFYMDDPHLKCKSLYLAIVDGIKWKNTYEGYHEWTKVATWALFYGWEGRRKEAEKYPINDDIFKDVEKKWLNLISQN
jgi:hypothetical protein